MERGYMKTPFKRLDKFVFDEHRFNTVEEAQNYVRRNNKSPDYMAIGGILYTMEEYDESGQTILYANRRNNLTLELLTTARYSNGFADAELNIYPLTSWRNDISYAD